MFSGLTVAFTPTVYGIDDLSTFTESSEVEVKCCREVGEDA